MFKSIYRSRFLFSQSANYSNDIWQPLKGLGVAETTLKKYSAEVLTKIAYESDDFADETAKSLLKNNQKSYYKKFMSLSIRNNEELPKDYPDALRNYINSTKLPAWADKKLLNEGGILFSRFTLPIGSILNWSSLPFLYAFPTGVEVLGRTGELTDNYGPRILNTSRLVTAVANPRGFEPEGKTIRTILKVRLTHAFVRQGILNSKEGWDTPKYFHPINQRDLLATLITFSALILDGMERFQADFTEEEIKAYMHLWNVTGNIIGIKDAYLPENYEEGCRILRSCVRYHSGNCEFGMKATQALINYLKKVTPGKVGDGIHETMMIHLLGEKLCELVGIKKKFDWTNLLVPVWKTGIYYYDEFGDRSRGFSKGAGFLARKFTEILVFIMRQGKTADFELAKKG